jgi:hypothetical protein
MMPLIIKLHATLNKITSKKDTGIMKDEKKVSFDEVQLREYPVVLSQNPAGQYGPAIEIGWEYRLASEVPPLKNVKYEKIVKALELDKGCTAVDEYEKIRPSLFRRNEKNLYLFVNQREHYARSNNFTDEEIEEARKKKEALFLQRRRSSRQNPVVRFKDGIEATRRTKKVKRAVRNLETKKIEPNEEGSIDGSIYTGWWVPLSAYILY